MGTFDGKFNKETSSTNDFDAIEIGPHQTTVFGIFLKQHILVVF